MAVITSLAAIVALFCSGETQGSTLDFELPKKPLNQAGTGAFEAWDMDVRQAIKNLLVRTNSAYTIDPDVNGTVFFRTRGMKAEEALRIMVRQVGARFKTENDIVRIYIHRGITLIDKYDDAMYFRASQSQAYIQMSGIDIKTFEVRDQPLDRVLGDLLRRHKVQHAVALKYNPRVTIHLEDVSLLTLVYILTNLCNAKPQFGDLVMIRD